jgi:tRNA(Ile)-lysidine synthase TilS/MesJ
MMDFESSWYRAYFVIRLFIKSRESEAHHLLSRQNNGWDHDETCICQPSALLPEDRALRRRQGALRHLDKVM